jgi:putative membrane protein
MHNLPIAFVLFFSVACAAACRDDAPPSTTTLSAAGASNSSLGFVAKGAPTFSLSDAQILEVTHVANAGEIAQAKLAEQKSSDARVKKLAAMMITDHTDADNKGAELARNEGLALAASTTSSSVKSDGGHILADLSSKSGADFDKAYVDAQVSEHTAVLRALDNQLIPNARDGQVQALLQTIRSKVAEHLTHAQTLRSELSE